MEVKDVSDDGVIGGGVSNFNSGALVRRSAENSEVSVTQFKVRESARLD